MSFEEHTSKFFKSSYDGKYFLFQCSIILLQHCQFAREVGNRPSFLDNIRASPEVNGISVYAEPFITAKYKLCSCSHKQTHFTNAFCILSDHEIGCQTGLIHQRLKDMCATRQHVTKKIAQPMNMHSSVALQDQSMWSEASMFFFQGINLVV